MLRLKKNRISQPRQIRNRNPKPLLRMLVVPQAHGPHRRVNEPGRSNAGSQSLCKIFGGLGRIFNAACAIGSPNTIIGASRNRSCRDTNSQAVCSGKIR